MRHLALPVVAVLAVLAGCKDNPAQTPTGPSAEAAAAVVKAPEKVSDEGESSLCAAYRTQLTESRGALERTPADESLRETVATYETVIADACP